jgi:histidinol-phosphate aminotransferase
MGAMKTRRAIASLNTYIPGERRRDAIKLASNENPLGCSPAVATAVADAVAELHIYPDGGARELTAALADHHGVDSAQIITGNGSDELLTLIAATYVEEGDEVLIGEHTFSEYEYAGRLFGAAIVPVPMPDLQIRPVDYLDYVTPRTRVVFLCTPNNPTGLAFSQRELAEFLSQISPEILVVVDHAYSEYQRDPGAARAEEFVSQHSNLVVLHTFSKVHGIATVRLGYGIAQRERIDEIRRVRPPFSVNGVAQAAGIAALRDSEFVQHTLSVNDEGRRRMEALLDELGWAWLPTQANFIATRVPLDARQAAAWIADRGVTVRALTGFGLPDYLRITIGTPEQIDILEPILRDLAAAHPG